MESGQRIPRKGRKLGSSRRRQTREPADGQDAPAAPEPESWSSQADAELQAFFQDCGAKDRGFVTREDLADAKFSFLGSEEEPQMIFDWVDMEQRGRLSLEEFSSGLKNVFGSSLSTHRLRRRRPLPSRVSVTTSFPALEEADAEEREAFLALMGQLGSSHILPEQTELWQLWGKLRQEDPQLAGNLEGFLARMSSRLQEVRADREALELTLRKRDTDHHLEVRRLYEEMEQQISREKQQLQAQSDSRGLALSSQMQEVLEAKEREVQKLAKGQGELEAQLHHLSDTQQEANSENQQLREAEKDLAGQLEEMRGQLQVTRRHLDAARGRVSWQIEEKPSVPSSSEKAPSPEEPPLPGLFGDNDDWSQLLNFSSPSHKAPQLSWSPPPTPRDASAPQTPRVVRQISISKSHAFGQEPCSDPDGAPRSPPGESYSTKDGKGVDPEGQDIGPECPVKPCGLEPDNEPGPRPKAHFPWSPGAPAEESGRLVAAALQALIPLEAGPAPQEDTPPPQSPAGSSKQFQVTEADAKGPGPEPSPAKTPRQQKALQELHAVGPEPGVGSQGTMALTEGPAEPSWGLRSVAQTPTEGLEQGKPSPAGQEGHPEGLREAPGQALRPDGLPASPLLGLKEESKAEEGKPVDHSRQDPGSERRVEAPGLETGHPESLRQDPPGAPPPADLPQAPVEAEAPAPGQLSPPGGSLPRAAAGSQEPTPPLPTLAELRAQPGPPATTVVIEEAGPSQALEPRAESRPEDLATDSREAGLTPSPGDPLASNLPADPDYLFHVIFLGDSNVGKTSFLHLLHQNGFATGLSATVGVDFRVKTLLVDKECFALQLWDTAGQERYHSLTRQLLRKADGVVLMYDVTSQESFAHVRYWLDCLQDAGSGQAVVLLLGNKMDCEEERQVPTEAGQQLAQELGVSFEECSAALGHNILEPMVNLARLLKVQEDRLKGSLVEVTSERPRKKAGCCF